MSVFDSEDPDSEDNYILLETVADIAFNCGFKDGCRELQDLSVVEGSRGLILWIIKKAKAFEEVYKDVMWDKDEGFGSYIEAIDRFTEQALKDRGLLKETEDELSE
jgi:hypothetical protein